MFCNDCGTRNGVDSKYCKECGAKVNDGYRTMMLTVEDLAGVEDDQGQQRLTRLLDMAFWHNEAGHTAAAIRAAEAALQIHPLCTTAHALLGSLYEKKGDDAKAIEHFEEVVRLNPDSEADATKLDQVRRGIHTKAVVQPPAYRWLPPALVGLTAGTFNTTDWKTSLRKPHPVLIAGAAGLLVLSVGWAMVKSAAPSRTMRVASATAVTPAPAVVGLPYGTVAPPAPVFLKPGAVANVKAKPFVPEIAPDGPFGETLPAGASTAPLGRTSSRSERAARVASRPRVGGNNDVLPPLSLKAVPLPSQSLAPMPISGITPAPAPMAAVESMPQHTVVVSRLASQGTPPPAPTFATAPSNGMSSDGGAPGQISIHISRSSNAEAISISDHSSPTRHTAEGGGAGDGDTFQQSALDLQNQGNFHQARSAYQKAIHAYKSQIASGHDTETAKRGLQASQTGLQICDQSQP
ncbi:MAG: tetratricopeptide repeat protein [Armatimonadota bacterium]|nr:tetratricopeptide repeat protein [Armatimonadota bacterium]